jgi:DNA-binding NarL/FixJ family response regulator
VLTAREAQVLKPLEQGMSNKMISRALGIKLPTVKNHVHRILAKLGIHGRAEAISLLRSHDGGGKLTAGKHRRDSSTHHWRD